MTSKHPESPLTSRSGFPSPAHLDTAGHSWREPTDEYLIGFSLQSWGTDAANQTAAVLEMQRRLKASIDALTTKTAAIAAEQLQAHREHTAAILAFDAASREFNAAAKVRTAELIKLSRESGRQADTMIRLTQWIIALTIILGIVAVLQLWAMFMKGP